jgi:hypothetical protein
MTAFLRRWGPWLVKLALSAVVMVVVCRKVDFAAAWASVRQIDWRWGLVALAAFSLQVPIGARRWQSIVTAINCRLPFADCLRLFYIAGFFNLLLPGAVGGDGFRIWSVRRLGMSLREAVNSVVLERVMTLFALFLLVSVMEPALLARAPGLHGAWIFPALTLAGAAGMIALTVVDRVPWFVGRLRLIGAMARIAPDARAVFLRPIAFTRVLSWSLIGHANLALVVWLLSLGLRLHLGLIDCLVLVPPVILLTTLPISIGGWGVREGAMVYFLSLVGVPNSSALALSVLFGLINTLVSLPAAAIWLSSPEREKAVLSIA